MAMGKAASGTLSALRTIVRGDSEKVDALFKLQDAESLTSEQHNADMHIRLKLQPDPSLVSPRIAAGDSPSCDFGGSRPDTERRYSPDISESEEEAGAHDVNWRLAVLQDRIMNQKPVRHTT
jgi:hypothetical protein